MNTLDSIRNFKMFRGQLKDAPLEEEHLLALIDAARWAPSGHNSQPCEFVYIDDRELIVKIARTVTANFDNFLASDPALPNWARKFRKWMRSSKEELAERGDGIYFKNFLVPEWSVVDEGGDDAAVREAMGKLFGSNGQSSRVIESAPCLLLTLLNTRRECPDVSNELLAATTAGAAMQNMRLAARELGISVLEQSLLYDLPVNREAVLQILGIPDYYRIVGGMRLGYRAKVTSNSFTNVRRPVGEILHRNGYLADK